MIGSLRSLLPENVNVMALSATATKPTFDIVVTRLSMCNVAVVGLSPMRAYIRYAVRMLTSLDELSSEIATGIKHLRVNYPKTVIFCTKCNDCSSLYKLLRSKLSSYFTYPTGTRDLQEFRLVDMYNSPATVVKKEKVLTAFTQEDSTLRVLIATTAFGMGVDCPNIRWVIHWSPPRLVEDYVQETGRSGRDGLGSTALLMYGHVHRDVSSAIKNYGENSSHCRKKHLFQQFMFSDCKDSVVMGCSCCDICANDCSCGQCQLFELPA